MLQIHTRHVHQRRGSLRRFEICYPIKTEQVNELQKLEEQLTEEEATTTSGIY